jgi:hypothetical protein
MTASCDTVGCRNMRDGDSPFCVDCGTHKHTDEWCAGCAGIKRAAIEQAQSTIAVAVSRIMKDVPLMSREDKVKAGDMVRGLELAIQLVALS